MADELKEKNQSEGERDERFDPPTRASDDCSVEDTRVRRSLLQTKSKKPQGLGDPV